MCDQHYFEAAGIVPGPYDRYYVVEVCRFCDAWFERPLRYEHQINPERYV